MRWVLTLLLTGCGSATALPEVRDELHGSVVAFDEIESCQSRWQFVAHRD